MKRSRFALYSTASVSKKLLLGRSTPCCWMKASTNGNNKAFEQSYNTQVAEHESRLILGNTLSDHPNDMREGVPTVQAIPTQLGTPDAAAMDAGYFSVGQFRDLKPWTSNVTLLQVETAISSIDGRFWRVSQNPRRRMPATRPRCSISCAPRQATPSTNCARAQLSRSSASSRRPSASDSFPCAD